MNRLDCRQNLLWQAGSPAILDNVFGVLRTASLSQFLVIAEKDLSNALTIYRCGIWLVLGWYSAIWAGMALLSFEDVHTEIGRFFLKTLPVSVFIKCIFH